MSGSHGSSAEGGLSGFDTVQYLGQFCDLQVRDDMFAVRVVFAAAEGGGCRRISYGHFCFRYSRTANARKHNKQAAEITIHAIFPASFSIGVLVQNSMNSLFFIGLTILHS
jgi:hypothetical protein